MLFSILNYFVYCNRLFFSHLAFPAPDEDWFCLVEILGKKFVNLSCPISLAFNFRYHMTRFSRWRTTAVGDEGPINPIEEATRLGASLATPEKAKITRERKMQTNPAGKNRKKKKTTSSADK